MNPVAYWIQIHHLWKTSDTLNTTPEHSTQLRSLSLTATYFIFEVCLVLAEFRGGWDRNRYWQQIGCILQADFA